LEDSQEMSKGRKTRWIYEITVESWVDHRWSDWLDGLEVTLQSANGGFSLTTLTGSFDQSALRGVLNRLWDLNLVLISVVRVRREA
jgi:hypothetical protein